jgi:hypothetical protein
MMQPTRVAVGYVPTKCSTRARRSPIGDVLGELDTVEPAYLTNTAYKAIERLTDGSDDNRRPTGLQRPDRDRLRVPRDRR